MILARTIIIGLCLAHGAWAGGAIVGQVTLPPAKSGAAGAARYQLKTGGTVAKPDAPAAAVYLEGQFSIPVTNTVVQMGQKGFQFAPGLLVVTKGAKVEFPNFDDEYHNVLSYSKAKELDLGRYRKDEKAPVITFDKAGVVELNCEIHEHMQGVILVVDSPHHTKTDATGKFRLENLPPGKFTLRAWANAKATWSKPVEIKEGETLTVNFP